MYVYILSFEKQLDPKSITLIPDLSGLLRRIFSGFKSQWINDSSLRYFKAYKIWIAKRLIKLKDTPSKLLFFMNSYRLMEKSSKEITKCFLNMQ